ncbi:MAG TPA: hypothetical protein VIL49_09360 [Capillimicrobium sp.]
MSGEEFTADEVDRAVAALQDPARLRHAQDVVTHGAPGLQRALNAALDQGGWFEAHEEQVLRAATTEDAAERLTALRVLLAEETQVAMMVGVAVGFELSRELQRQRED